MKILGGRALPCRHPVKSLIYIFLILLFNLLLMMCIYFTLPIFFFVIKCFCLLTKFIVCFLILFIF